jgi:molybdenum cofactor cytidylyltransferase
VIAGIVLAGGEGRRFGAVKQLAPLHGRPLLEHAVEAMRGVPAIDPLIVVLGAAADEIRAGADLSGARVVVAADWAEGQAASLRAGLAAAGDAEAVVVTLADQPGITAQVIAGALDHRDARRHDAVRATYAGVPGHPVVLERRAVARAAELRGDTGARAVLGELRVCEWECGHLADATDVDTPEALEVLRR